MNVVFTEGENDNRVKILKPKVVTQECLIHERCEKFLDNGKIRTFNSCPQIQCPAFTYRSGLYNP